jgi:flagellar basal-body rod protein FlgB
MDSGNALLTIKALDGLAARATVTSENIANANTRGYRPLRVTFEDALRKAALEGDGALAAFEPRVERAPIDGLPNGGELRLDLEMGSASTTALRYGALISMLGRELELQSLAASGGK